MFEYVGLMVLRALGLGWLWGELPEGDVFGNGNPVLMAVGFSAMVSCLAVGWLLAS